MNVTGAPYTRTMSENTLTIETVKRHAPDWLILSIACIAQFMVVLDVSIVNVALPRMGHDLHFSYLERAVGRQRVRPHVRGLPPARRTRR